MRTRQFKSFRIITFGCRVNQAESRMMGEELVRNKFIKFNELLVKKEKLDIMIINTCCVTNKAEREVRKEIRRVKRENPKCFLVVAGCWVNKVKSEKLKVKSCSSKLKVTDEHSEILRLIDLLITNEEKKNTVEILKKQFSNRTMKQCSNGAIYKDKYAKYKKAMVKIQSGCDNFCTYCIVPYVRGRSKSRYLKEIINEIKKLVKQGIEEVVLTGIDIASFNFQFSNPNFQSIFKSQFSNYKNDLVKLILLILAETKIKKISFGSMGIEVFDDEFIRLYQLDSLSSAASFDPVPHKCGTLSNLLSQRESNSKNCVFPRAKSTIDRQPSPAPVGAGQAVISHRLSSRFHIPLQSGCDETLRRMNRKYSISNFQFLISKLKKEIPNFSFSTDIIVGFPGESRREFKKTMTTITTIKTILGKNFIKIHVFRYSPKKGTMAEKMEQKWGMVDGKEKKSRAKALQFLIFPAGF